MISKSIIPCHLELEKKSILTSFTGLLPYLELFQVMDIIKIISKHLKIRPNTEGFTDVQILVSLILLQMAGGDSIEDLNQLRNDEGFKKIVRKSTIFGKKRFERRKIERKWKKGKEDPPEIPSLSVVRTWMDNFHNEEAEKKRPESGCHIPEKNNHLLAMELINKSLLEYMYKQNPNETVILDMDATLIESNKKTARFCYKGFSGYQPFNVWDAKQQMIVHTEFRDGNVCAGFEQLRILKESISMLPSSVSTILVRSDSAGYQYDFMKFCQERKENSNKPKVNFVIASNVSESFREEVKALNNDDWKTIYKKIDEGTNFERVEETKQQWTEVSYNPTGVLNAPKEHIYRYIAIREKLDILPCALPSKKLSTYKTDRHYKLYAIVTNIDFIQNEEKQSLEELKNDIGNFKEDGMWGNSIIHWHRKRCGRSEQAHSIMKSDFGGGKMPSSKFGTNAAWWWITMLALNFQRIMSKLALPKELENSRMKKVRLKLISIPSIILERGRQLFIRLSNGAEKALYILNFIRERLSELRNFP